MTDLDPVAALRREYERHGLDAHEAAPDPILQFNRWFQDALAAGIDEPNAMTLATATPDGRPSARIVLLKGVEAGGFDFYTNYRSRKGRELNANGWAALVFWWGPLERQVRVEGRVELLPEDASDAYFQVRPRGSKLGAWASPQSEVIPGRNTLDHNLAEAEARFADGPVPRPEHWGGFRLTPDRVEFWQGRPNRLHDRLRYRRGEKGWILERLAP